MGYLLIQLNNANSGHRRSPSENADMRMRTAGMETEEQADLMIDGVWRGGQRGL